MPVITCQRALKTKTETQAFETLKAAWMFLSTWRHKKGEYLVTLAETVGGPAEILYKGQNADSASAAVFRLYYAEGEKLKAQREADRVARIKAEYAGRTEELSARLKELNAMLAKASAELERMRQSGGGFSADMYATERVQPINARIDAVKEILSVLASA